MTEPRDAALDGDTARAVLELAVRAPSVHNSQPWRFQVCADQVRLYADPRRHLPAIDPDGRDLLISCGAALHHLRVALAAFGWFADTDHLPDPDDPNLLATLRLIPRAPTRADLALAVSIPRRRCDRRRYPASPVPDAALQQLMHAASAQGAVAGVVRDPSARGWLVSAIAEADAVQRNDPRYIRELAQWTGIRGGTEDGVPAGTTPEDVDLGDVPLRRFDATRLHDPVRSERDGTGTLMVIGTTDDDRESWLRVGEATSAVLLTATTLRLVGCPLTQPLEVPRARRILRTIVLDNTMEPHMVLRVGLRPVRDNPFPRTRRRPVSEVLEECPEIAR